MDRWCRLQNVTKIVSPQARHLCYALLVLHCWQHFQWNWVHRSMKSAPLRWRDHRASDPFCLSLSDCIQCRAMGIRLYTSPPQNVIPAALLRPSLKSLCSLAVVAVPHGRGRWHRRKRNQRHVNEQSWWSSVWALLLLCCHWPQCKLSQNRAKRHCSSVKQ